MLKSQDSDETNAKQNLKNGCTSDDDNLTQLHDDDDEVIGDNEEKLALSNNSRSHRSQMVCKGNNDNIQYEDPMVSELKQTEVSLFLNQLKYFSITKMELTFSQSEICTN